MAVPGLEVGVLPGQAGQPALAGVLHRPVPRRRGQQHVLPAAATLDIRRMAAPYTGGLRVRGQDEPLPDPYPPAPRPGRAGVPIHDGGQWARGETRAGLVPAAADLDRRRRGPGRGAVPARRPRPGPGRAASSVLVGRADPDDTRSPWRGAVLGGPGRSPGDAAVADGGLRLPADASRHGPASTALRSGCDPVLG